MNLVAVSAFHTCGCEKLSKVRIPRILSNVPGRGIFGIQSRQSTYCSHSQGMRPVIPTLHPRRSPWQSQRVPVPFRKGVEIEGLFTRHHRSGILTRTLSGFQPLAKPPAVHIAVDAFQDTV